MRAKKHNHFRLTAIIVGFLAMGIVYTAPVIGGDPPTQPVPTIIEQTSDVHMTNSQPNTPNKLPDDKPATSAAPALQPASPTPPVSAPAPAAASNNSVQVDEQFNGTALDSSVWEAITYPTGYRNNEEQDYRPSQVRVANGNLILTAERDAQGAWHSGEVHSKWAYTYGEFEVRMAVSATGPGTWPAAWLMPPTGQWPDIGEIDIIENVNGNTDAVGTIHGGGSQGHWQIARWMGGVNVTQYHTYKIVKQPELISWWVDGVKRGEWTRSQLPAGAVWPFENYKNMGLLNLAIGGNWPGPSNASTPSVIHMNVDSFTVKNAY